jgi:hypothetical protein
MSKRDPHAPPADAPSSGRDSVATQPSEPIKPAKNARETRETRLAEALRENLKRRKASGSHRPAPTEKSS